ncbi:MAG: helix-turn-helix transcriptional regulator [Planctomycetaceae bacterium]|nr:helix-turn-helix transcriptional regulator [Planctomycetaceae bacterium]
MAHKFETLLKKMKPTRIKRAKAKAKELMAEMLLTEIRRKAGFTQQDIAHKLGMKQPSLSKLESQDDMQISTLQRLIKALGGQLELIAHMPSGDIKVGQFK